MSIDPILDCSLHIQSHRYLLSSLNFLRHLFSYLHQVPFDWKITLSVPLLWKQQIVHAKAKGSFPCDQRLPTHHSLRYYLSQSWKSRTPSYYPSWLSHSPPLCPRFASSHQPFALRMVLAPLPTKNPATGVWKKLDHQHFLSRFPSHALLQVFGNMESLAPCHLSFQFRPKHESHKEKIRNMGRSNHSLWHHDCRGSPALLHKSLYRSQNCMTQKSIKKAIFLPIEKHQSLRSPLYWKRIGTFWYSQFLFYYYPFIYHILHFKNIFVSIHIKRIFTFLPFS